MRIPRSRARSSPRSYFFQVAGAGGEHRERELTRAIHDALNFSLRSITGWTTVGRLDRHAKLHAYAITGTFANPLNESARIDPFGRAGKRSVHRVNDELRRQRFEAVPLFFPLTIPFVNGRQPLEKIVRTRIELVRQDRLRNQRGHALTDSSPVLQAAAPARSRLAAGRRN